MKAFTDIEQSKKLAAILPLESADMFLALEGKIPVMARYIEDGFVTADDTAIPCWSLVALADILRKDFEVCIIGYEKAWKCHITNRKTLVTDWLLADNPIDACYGMILKLHEQKLL